jgi:hypothetical protein
MNMLPAEEYIEQAYLFRILAERVEEQLPMQELLEQTRFELLATTKLPMAVDFLLTELKHSGIMGTAMKRLAHYFTPFQSYLIDEAESDSSRFDIRNALLIMQAEADLRAKLENRQGLFFFQFEALCRNRLRYDPGLTAMSEDPFYDQAWRDWLLILRRQIGFVEIAELIYVRSEEYFQRRKTDVGMEEPEAPLLFGRKEGRIALANHRKDPLYLFAAMQRHLGYPPVPRPRPVENSEEQLPALMRRVERLESRIKFIEEEQRQGIDLSKFYQSPNNRDP